MANKRVTNKLSQVVPLQHTASSGLKTYLLKSRESVVMNETHLSQSITDLASAGYVTVATSTDPVTANVGTDWS